MENRADTFEAIHSYWGYYVPTYVAIVFVVTVAQISESFPEHTSLVINWAVAIFIGLPAGLLIQMPWFKGRVKFSAALVWTILVPLFLLLMIGFTTEWLL